MQSRARRVLRHLLIVAAVVVGAALFVPVAAADHYQYWDGYSYGNSTCTDRKDPVTVFFVKHGFTSYTNDNIKHHTSLDAGSSPGAQKFWRSGQCLSQTIDRSNCVIIVCNRKHIRGRLSAFSTSVHGWQHGTTPHVEQWKPLPPCWGNHAVNGNGPNGSGFDQGREYFRARFNPSHGVSFYYWGNTQSMQQCNGNWAGSNGWVINIFLPHTH